MRLWSLHPRQLDRRGLVALWREGLLARAVLRGGTRGYRKHPQLARFAAQADRVQAIDAYLDAVQLEAARRGYTFDRARMGTVHPCPPIDVTNGQLAFEWARLMEKMRLRDPDAFGRLQHERPEPHPLFRVVDGPVEPWERVDAPRPKGRTV